MIYRGYPAPPDPAPGTPQDALIQRYEYTEGNFPNDEYDAAIVEYARSGFTPFQFTDTHEYGMRIRFRRPVYMPRKYQDLHILDADLIATCEKLEAKGWEVVSVRPGRLTSVHAVMVTARQRVIG